MKTYLFIDGTNLYAAQYELFGPNKYLNFSVFISEIQKQLHTTFHKIYFYASYSPKTDKPSQKEKLFLKNEGLFYRSVRQTKNVIFFTGYRSPTSKKEKEVDVKLAVDIVDLGYLNKYDCLYFYSGDADFMHALFVATRLGKKVTIIATENRIPMRFTYNYQTYLFIFLKNRKIKFTLNSKQKVKLIYLDNKNLINKI